MFKKKIIIKDKKDLKKFYNNIKYYRSILFIFTKFECDNKDVEHIITALNIKNRFKRIRYVYDTACDEVDAFGEGKNLCGFKNGVCRSKVKNGCCRKCFHVTDHGCPTRNLACKLFFCSKVRDKYKIIMFDDLKILYCLSFRCRVILRHDFFTKREEVLMDMYIGWITILFIRYFYRVIKHKIILLFRKTKK